MSGAGQEWIRCNRWRVRRTLLPDVKMPAYGSSLPHAKMPAWRWVAGSGNERSYG